MGRSSILCGALAALMLTACVSDNYDGDSQPEASITFTEDEIIESIEETKAAEVSEAPRETAASTGTSSGTITETEPEAVTETTSEAVTEVSGTSAAIPAPDEEENTDDDPDAENLFYQGLTIAVKDGKKGYINKSGSWVAEPIFDNTYGFYAGNIAVVRLGEKYGCIDRNGNYIIKPELDFLSFFGCDKYGIYAAAKGADGREKFGLMDEKGKWIIEPRFDYISGFQENGLSVASITDEDGNIKQGLIDTSGRWVADPVYDRIGDFSNGMAFVCIDDKYGYIDEKGNMAIKPQFAAALNFFDNGTAVVMDENRRYGLIDKKGKIIADTRFYEVDHRNGFAGSGLAFAATGTSGRDAKYGFINKSGEWVIKPQFAKAKAFSRNGLAAAAIKDDSEYEKWGYIDKSGKWVIEPVFNQAYNFDDDGLALVDSDFFVFGVIDRTGNYVIEPEYDYISYDYATEMLYDEDLIHVEKDGKYGYFDRKGNEVIKTKYTALGGFAPNGLALVRDDNNKIGFINKAGDIVIDFRFD